MSKVGLAYVLMIVLFGVFLVVISIYVLCQVPGADGGVCTAL